MPASETTTSLDPVGAEILASVLSVWAQAAIDWLQQDPDLQAVAVLRDGALAGEAVIRLAPDMAHRVGAANLSRRHVGIAAIADADDHENLLNFLVRMRHRPASWGEATTELGLPPGGQAPDTPLQEHSLRRFWDWLRLPPVAACLADRTTAARKAVLAHLDRSVAADRPLLLLDVGYAATVQRCLKRISLLAGRPRPIHGLYLLTSSGAKWAMTGDGEVRGLLAQSGEPAAIAAALLRHRDVIEALLAQPCGELAALSAEGQATVAPSPLPAVQLALVAAMQRAALAALRPDVTIAHATSALIRLLLTPTSDEARLIGAWRHADSTALDGMKRLDDGPADGGRGQCLWPAAARWRQDGSARGD